MPLQIVLSKARRAVRIKNDPLNTKLKIRTLTVQYKKKADEVKQSLPPVLFFLRTMLLSEGIKCK